MEAPGHRRTAVRRSLTDTVDALVSRAQPASGRAVAAGFSAGRSGPRRELCDAVRRRQASWLVGWLVGCNNHAKPQRRNESGAADAHVADAPETRHHSPPTPQMAGNTTQRRRACQRCNGADGIAQRIDSRHAAADGGCVDAWASPAHPAGRSVVRSCAGSTTQGCSQGGREEAKQKPRRPVCRPKNATHWRSGPAMWEARSTRSNGGGAGSPPPNSCRVVASGGLESRSRPYAR